MLDLLPELGTSFLICRPTNYASRERPCFLENLTKWTIHKLRIQQILLFLILEYLFNQVSQSLVVELTAMPR